MRSVACCVQLIFTCSTGALGRTRAGCTAAAAVPTPHGIQQRPSTLQVASVYGIWSNQLNDYTAWHASAAVDDRYTVAAAAAPHLQAIQQHAHQLVAVVLLLATEDRRMAAHR
jgi:hypothetical protein